MFIAMLVYPRVGVAVVGVNDERLVTCKKKSQLEKNQSDTG